MAALASGQAIKDSAGQVFETESAYNYIQVQRANGITILRLNDGEGIHSVYSPDTLNYGGPWSQFLVGPYFYPDASPSAGAAHCDRRARPPARRRARRPRSTVRFPSMVSSSIPGSSRSGKEFFGENLPNLTVHIGDGRWNLEESGQRYDIIAVDAYRPPYIPPHMTTQRVLPDLRRPPHGKGQLGNQCRKRARRPPPHRRPGHDDGRRLPFHLRHGYPRDLEYDDLCHEAANLGCGLCRESRAVRWATPIVHPLLLSTMATTFANLQPGYQTTQVFTDDHAPIEWIVDDMVVRFALSGQLDSLQP